MTLIKSSIPEGDGNDGYNYSNILYIIQIIFSSPLSVFIGIFIFLGFLMSTGIMHYLDGCSDCSLILYNFTSHKYIFYLCSFVLCFGGLWIRMVDCWGEYEYGEDCCDIGDNCCNVYCMNNIMFCDCCFCDKNSCCFSICCYKNCNTCKICGCSKKSDK